MQKETKIKKYWDKDNFFKSKQLKPKSTISQSVKGICTNIWYKLGGQSILTKKYSSKFQNLTMLGKKYSCFQNAQIDFHQLFWFTYRKQIKIQGQIMSDLGWGCLIRVGQMLLANSLKIYFENSKTSISEQNILFAFLDDSQGIRGNYSFQRILEKGKQRFKLKTGQWFNISQICYILMSIQNNLPMKGSQQFKMIYFNQTLIFLDQIFQKIDLPICLCKQQKIKCQLCNNRVSYRKKSKQYQFSNKSDSFDLEFQLLNFNDQDFQLASSDQKSFNQQSPKNPNQQSKDLVKHQAKFDLLLVVSTRISHSAVDQKNYEGILQLMNLPTSLGMIGGVPGKGLYFVGTCDDNLIYLDPHLVQNPVNTFNLSKQLSSFHCQNLRLINRQKLDPSIAFAFYIKNLNDLSQLISTIDKIKIKNPQAVPISYMWENQFKDDSQPIKSNQFQMDQYSPDFSFIA